MILEIDMQICKFRSREKWEVSVKSLVKEAWRCHLQPALPCLSRCRHSCSKSVSFSVSCVGMSPLRKCVEMTHSWLPYGLKHFYYPSPISVQCLFWPSDFLLLVLLEWSEGSSTCQASALLLGYVLVPGFLTCSLSHCLLILSCVSVSWLGDFVWFCEMCFWINTPIAFGQWLACYFP